MEKNLNRKKYLVLRKKFSLVGTIIGKIKKFCVRPGFTDTRIGPSEETMRSTSL